MRFSSRNLFCSTYCVYASQYWECDGKLALKVKLRCIRSGFRHGPSSMVNAAVSAFPETNYKFGKLGQKRSNGKTTCKPGCC